MSDHNPQDVETKRLPFAEAAPGAIGLETMLARACAWSIAAKSRCPTLLKRHVHAAGRTARPCRRHACAPARPADVIVVDTETPWVLDPAELKSKCKNTPFDEARLQAGRHHRGRTHRLRIRPGRHALLRDTYDRMPVLDRLLTRGRMLVSAISRLDSVRPYPHAAAGGRTFAPSAPAISAPPMCCAPAARGSPRRRLSATRSKARSRCSLPRICRPPCGARRRPRRVPRPSVSGLAQVQRRQGRRDFYRPPPWLYWPAALIFCAIWLAVARADPLFLARRTDRQRADARCRVGTG